MLVIGPDPDSHVLYTGPDPDPDPHILCRSRSRSTCTVHPGSSRTRNHVDAPHTPTCCPSHHADAYDYTPPLAATAAMSMSESSSSGNASSSERIQRSNPPFPLSSGFLSASRQASRWRWLKKSLSRALSSSLSLSSPSSAVWTTWRGAGGLGFEGVEAG